MKLDEFAFFNQQLAAMLREGIPLEGALRQLSGSMQRGTLKTEVQALEADLARGKPLAQALAARQLPALYRRMLTAGAQGQDLTGFLSRVADHYHEQHLLWTRLKGLMTYPLLVLTAVFGLSLLVHAFMKRVYGDTVSGVLGDFLEGADLPAMTQMTLPLLMNSWVFPVSFGLMLLAALAVLGLPGLRERVLWRLPAFREAALARIAGTLSLLLDRAVPLPEAVTLVEDLEDNHRAAAEIRTWRTRLAQGVSNLSEVMAGGRFFPPLFSWLVVNGGAGLAEGFGRASEIYRTRASARTEIMMHAALPVAVLTLGVLVALQALMLLALFLPFITLIDQLGS